MKEKTFGEILKTHLEDRGISQRWLADAAHTKEATISRYVNGVNQSARMDILASIAKALDVSADYLIGISDEPRPKLEFTKEERLLIRAFKKASEDDIETVWCVMKKYMTPAEKMLLTQLEDTRQSKTG